MLKRIIVIPVVGICLYSGTVFAESVAPIVEGIGNSKIMYVQGKDPVRAATDIVIKDPDSEFIEAATVNIVNAPENSDELLTVDTAGSNITQLFVNNTLVLEGKATPETYTKVLRSLIYSDGNAPAKSARNHVELHIIVNDGLKVGSASQYIGYAQMEQVASQMQAEVPEVPAKVDTKAPFDLKVASDAVSSAPVAEEAQKEEPMTTEGLAGMHAAGEAVKPQSLNEVMAKAYLNNKALAAEREHVKIVSEDVTGVRAEFLPNITASAAAGPKNGDHRSAAGTIEHDGTASEQDINIRLPLFDGLGSMSRFKRERNQLEAAKAKLEAIEQEVLLSAVASYMDVVRAKQTLDIALDKEEALRRHYDGTKERSNAGKVTQTDVSQSYTRLTRSITERIEADGAYETSKAVYQHVVGEAPYGLYLQVEDPLGGVVEDEKLIQEALANNPSLKIGSYHVKAAKDNIGVARSTMLPSLSLDADKNWQKGRYLADGFDKINEESLMLRVSIPIYQGGAEYAKIRQAKRAEAKLAYDLEEQENAMREDMIRAIRDYQVALSSIDIYEANAKTAQTALNGLKEDAQAGKRTIIDMLDAEQEAFEAKILLLRAKRDRIVSAYKVKELLGELTATKLNLPVEYHNPDAYYQDVKNRFIGY